MRPTARLVRGRQVFRGAAVSAALALVLTSCSSNSNSGGDAPESTGASGTGSGTVTIDLGGGRTLDWKTGQKLKIAYFQFARGNGFLQTEIDAAEDQARKVGAELTVFDAQADPQKQFNQMQTALATGGYNAWMLTAVNGTLICNIVTRDAPAKGIAVVVQTPVCGKDAAIGADALSPGEVGYVGGQSSLSTWQAIADYVAKDNPGPTSAIVLQGSAGQGTTLTSQQAFDAMVKAHPNIKILASYPTNYTVQDGFNLTQQALQQHPDLDVIISVYSGDTQGAIKALSGANRAGKVKIYDQGGDESSVVAIKAGNQTMTNPLFPASQSRTAVNMFDELNKGQITRQKLVLNDGYTGPGATAGEVFLLDKTNVDTFKAEYR